MFKIPQNTLLVIDRLTQNGHTAYIVGGCVRDILLNKTPNDFDITTSAKPDQIISLFKKTIPTGIKHGTVTVLIENEPIEITTFRADGNYTDNRRPDSVTFVSDLKEDLSRRDFTVNALAYNHLNGLQDFFGGQSDLKNKILRAVGDPETRFKEDALRILRLFRFAAALSFSIEEQTLNAAVKCADLLKNVSRERIFEELKKAVDGDNPSALKPLIECGGLEFLGVTDLPDFQKIKTFKGLLGLYILLGSRGLENLKPSNRERQYFKGLDTLKNMPCETDCDIKEMLNLTEEKIVKDFFRLYALDIKKLDAVIGSGEPFSVKQLAINGDDLIKAGFKGEKIGELLEHLRKFVIIHPKKNNKTDLLNEIP